MRTNRSLFVVAGLLLFARVAPAQVDLRVESDSIELAVLKYAKAHRRVAPATIVVDSRIRTPEGFAAVRGALRSGRLAEAIGATVVDFGCDNRKPTCMAPKADLGLVLHAPVVKGDLVQVTVEMHTPTGRGIDVYELARAGKGWQVTKIVSRNAT